MKNPRGIQRAGQTTGGLHNGEEISGGEQTGKEGYPGPMRDPPRQRNL